MNDKTEVIVINVNEYKDNDAIVNVLSKEYGRLSFYVRGFKKINGKNIYATQLLNHSTFIMDYNPNKKIQLLKSATLIEEFAMIRSDYEKITIASMICEIADKSGYDNLFDLLNKTLKYLNELDQPYLVLNIFLAEILKILGISPYVDGCVLCGRTDNIETISLEDGGFLCHKCNQGQNSNISLELLRKFRYINKANIDIMDKLINLHLNDFAICDLLMNILVIYSGMQINSYKSLTNLNF